MSKEMVIVRQPSGKVQTLGELTVYENGVPVYTCKTLELAWKDNRKNISSVPEGCYWVTKYNSPTKGRCFLLHNVPNRSYIEIHKGNFYYDIEGCILPGKTFTDLNGDGYLDVTSSAVTLDELLDLMPHKFQIRIK